MENKKEEVPPKSEDTKVISPETTQETAPEKTEEVKPENAKIPAKEKEEDKTVNSDQMKSMMEKFDLF